MSLLGHVLIYQLLFALPLMVTFLYLNSSDGALTHAWAIHIIIAAAIGGLFMAACTWCLFALPRLKTRSK